METRPLWLVALSLAACAAESEVTDSSPAGPSAGAEVPEALLLESADLDLVVQVPARADMPFSLKSKRFVAELQVRIDGATDAPRSGENGAWTYRDALGEGSDLVLAQTADGLEDWVRMEKPGRVAYRVGLGSNIAGLRSLGPSVEFLDARGTPVLRVGNAFAIDQLGERAELSFEVEGCDIDTDPRTPWRRPVRAPGSRECVLAVRVPSDMQGPIWVDPLWTTADALNTARWGAHVAVAGAGAQAQLLAIGGMTGSLLSPPSDVVEAFDPATLTWSTLAPLSYAFEDGRAVTLADGRVLVVGGEGATGALASAKLFDPTTTTWTDAASMNEARRRHTATVLLDGRVLVTGGSIDNTSSDTAEVYDPTSNTWTLTSNMTSPRAEAAAVRLPDGKVLVTGGYGGSSFPRDSSELWDPQANAGQGAFEMEIVMPGAIYAQGIAMWGSDRVIVVGGESASFVGLVSFDQEYDIVAKTWSEVALGSNRGYPGVETLNDGSVIVFGGCNHDPIPTSTLPCFGPLASVRLYPADGDAPIELPGEDLSLARGRIGSARLPDGRVIAAGGSGTVTASPQTEVFAYYANGDICTLAQACASGFCVDGICCESACDDLCESCVIGVIGTAGQCVAHATGSDPDDDCANDGALCEQTGECGAVGCELHPSSDCVLTPCMSNEECASGVCSDEICCDVACDTNCASCRSVDTGQADGECHPILRGTDPAGECVDGMAGDCTSTLLCDGSYQCIQAESLCAPYVCTEQGCRESCETDGDCSATFACIAGECVLGTMLCTDETMGLSKDGTVVDCAPFQCKPDGSCFQACDSLDECEPGLVCDDSNASCVEPPNSSGGDEGCVCNVRALEGGSPRSLAPWLLLLVAMRRGGRRHR